METTFKQQEFNMRFYVREALIGLTGVGRLPRKFRSEFSPNRYDSGWGVSNLSPPIIKWLPK